MSLSILHSDDRALLRKCLRFYISHHKKTDSYKLLIHKLDDFLFTGYNNEESLTENRLPTSKEVYGLASQGQIPIPAGHEHTVNMKEYRKDNEN